MNRLRMGGGELSEGRCITAEESNRKRRGGTLARGIYLRGKEVDYQAQNLTLILP